MVITIKKRKYSFLFNSKMPNLINSNRFIGNNIIFNQIKE